MIKFDGLYEIRDSVKEVDRNFVLSTFLISLYSGDSWFRIIPRRIFMDNYKRVVEALYDHNNCVVKVACLKEDPTVILGYSVLSKDYQTVHWIYVKKAWRKKGIGSNLCPKYFTTATHLSNLGLKLLEKYKNVTFNPFKLE